MNNFHSKFSTRHKKTGGLLCVGLDPELEKLPDFLQKETEPLFVFCKEIVDSTAEYCIGFKPNIAFFERYGSSGILQFEKLIDHIHKKHSESLIIADAKRGDLANTSKEYASYFFKSLHVDSLTVSPYMGKDSTIPYLEADGFVFLLCLTSNAGSSDLQRKVSLSDNKPLYISVADMANDLCEDFPDSTGLVVGATHPHELKELREKYPSLIFLIPGYGAQGATLDDIIPNSKTNSIINSSRSIIFASPSKDFADKARQKAKEINEEMKAFSKSDV
jgi:orotidine-5'-phosphate decarboxylase